MLQFDPLMESDKETHMKKQRAGCRAAVKEGCRISSTTFLSLLPPLSFLLFTRFSASRHQTPLPTYELQQQTLMYAISLFLHTTTTLTLSFLIFLAAVASILQSLSSNQRAFLSGVRRRLQCAVVWLSSMQVCLSLWIHGFVGAEIISGGRAGSLAFVRNLVLPLGLYEATLLWRWNVVKPVVDDAVLGFSEEGFSLVENVLLATAFYCLWWWRLRREAEELLVLRGNVEVVDVVGWLFYTLMTAIGGARVVKGLLCAAQKIFRRRHQPVVELRDFDSFYNQC